MDYSEIKFLLLVIVTISFLFELISGLLNFNSFDKPLPENVKIFILRMSIQNYNLIRKLILNLS